MNTHEVFMFHGIVQDNPPPVPPRRGYKIPGDDKTISFPHLRTLAFNYHQPPHQPLEKG